MPSNNTIDQLARASQLPSGSMVTPTAYEEISHQRVTTRMRGPRVTVRQPSVVDIANRDAERLMREEIARMFPDYDHSPSKPKSQWVINFIDGMPQLAQARWGAATKQEAIDNTISNYKEEQSDILRTINRRMTELATTRKRLASLQKLAAS